MEPVVSILLKKRAKGVKNTFSIQHGLASTTIAANSSIGINFCCGTGAQILITYFYNCADRCHAASVTDSFENKDVDAAVNSTFKRFTSHARARA